MQVNYKVSYKNKDIGTVTGTGSTLTQCEDNAFDLAIKLGEQRFPFDFEPDWDLAIQACDFEQINSKRS